MGYADFVSGGENRKGERAEIGLCAECVYGRRIESARGSVFYLCERSATDPAFPKYPWLPVMECSGYDEARAKGTA